MLFIDRFRRATSGKRKYIPVVDGLRFIAILAVIAFHVQQIASYHFGRLNQPIHLWNGVELLFSRGHLGVELFFMISGFILCLPFAEHYLSEGRKVGLKSYYTRRLTRLEPPYVIHLALVVLLSWGVLMHLPSHPLLYQKSDWFGELMGHILPSLFYSHVLINGTYPYPNIVLWSLEAEVQFYILAPFLATVFSVRNKRRRQITICGMLVISSLCGYFLPSAIARRVLIIDSLPFFLAGFLLADVYLTGRKSPGSERNHWWDMVWPLTLAAVILSPAAIILTPWLMFVLGLCAFRGKLVAGFLENQWVSTIGGMCYSIYMYHWFMISGLIRVTGGIRVGNSALDLVIQFVVISPIIIVFSAVLFLLFEKPFMRPAWYLASRPGTKQAIP